MLCDDLEVWGGVVGRVVHAGGNICMYIADALHCIEETNKYCKVMILQFKKIEKDKKVLKKMGETLPF